MEKSFRHISHQLQEVADVTLEKLRAQFEDFPRSACGVEVYLEINCLLDTLHHFSKKLSPIYRVTLHEAHLLISSSIKSVKEDFMSADVDYCFLGDLLIELKLMAVSL